MQAVARAPFPNARERFDAYRCVYVRKKLRRGNRSLRQRARSTLMRELYSDSALRAEFAEALAPERNGVDRIVKTGRVIFEVLRRALRPGLERSTTQEFSR